jgi:hypothetical protein
VSALHPPDRLPRREGELAEDLVAGTGVPGDVLERPGLEVGGDAGGVGAGVEVGEERPAGAASLLVGMDAEEPG